MFSLKPKKFIKSTQKSKEYECCICNYIAEKPFHCLGPCKNLFCEQCMKCIKMNSNECPYKCSKPFELVQGKEVELEYQCPFNPEKCEEAIESLNQFYSHWERCKFVPEDWKEREENYHKYRCEKGHNLIYLDQSGLYVVYGYNFYQEMQMERCSLCKQKNFCRSICPQCSVKGSLNLFCADCRKTPCTKNTCPFEHQLEKALHYDSGTQICDFCGTAVYLYGPNVYKDRKCNFDICESCFVKLPETHELVPFKMPKNVIDHLNRIGQNNMAYEEEEQQESEQGDGEVQIFGEEEENNNE